MPNIKVLFAAVLFAAACSFTAFAQDAPGKFVRSKFVSLDGGFTIDLPSKTDAAIEPTGSLSAGAGTFSWKNDMGSFTVGFVDGISAPPEEGFAALNQLAESVTSTQSSSGSKVVHRSPFSFGGHPGIELRVERPNGARAINRFILVGRRLYVLTADWPASKDEPAARLILDSFEPIDTKALIA
jgi:hypothetical protein